MPNDRVITYSYVPPVAPEPERGTYISDSRFNIVDHSIPTPEESVSMISTFDSGIPTNFRDALRQYAVNRISGPWSEIATNRNPASEILLTDEITVSSRSVAMRRRELDNIVRTAEEYLSRAKSNWDHQIRVCRNLEGGRDNPTNAPYFQRLNALKSRFAAKKQGLDLAKRERDRFYRENNIATIGDPPASWVLTDEEGIDASLNTEENESMPTDTNTLDSYEFNRELITQRTRGYPRYELNSPIISPSFIAGLSVTERELDMLNHLIRHAESTRRRYMTQYTFLQNVPSDLTTVEVSRQLDDLNLYERTATRATRELSQYIERIQNSTLTQTSNEETQTSYDEQDEVDMPTISAAPDNSLDELFTSTPTPRRNSSGDSTDTLIRDLRLRYTNCYGYIEDGTPLDISKIFFVLNFDVSSRDVVNIQYITADGSAAKVKPWDKDRYIFALPKLGYINANYLAVLFRRKHKKSDNNKFKRGFQYGLYPAIYLNYEESRKAEIIIPDINQLNAGSSVFGYKMYMSLLSEDSYISYEEAISGIMTGQRLSTALNNKYVIELVSYNNIIILKRLQFIIGVYDQVGKKFTTSNELFNKELDDLNIPYEYVRGSI